ncbi:MAG TPA: hypothetical protein VFT31_10140 [Kribbella sp.]|nr:hypothetical protein [Kribbella sp.]
MTNVLPTTLAPRSALLRSVGYAAALAPLSLLATARSMVGRSAEAHRTWSRLARTLRSPEPVTIRRPGAWRSLGYGVLGVVLGLVCWFLLFMLVTAVLRGVFYGFVTDGPYGPGTWGGPTKAGAWAVHAAVSIPVLIVVPLLLRGIGLMHCGLIRRLYGASVAWWVLPATIVSCSAGMLLLYSWTQQL